MLEYFTMSECWLILWLFLSLINAVDTFKCGSHHDECTAGYMYCVKEEDRCHNCDDGVYTCGVDMPVDCLPYCNDRSREVNERRLNSTISQLQRHNSELQVSIQWWQTWFGVISAVVVLAIGLGVGLYLCVRWRKSKQRSHNRSKPADIVLGQQRVENGEVGAPSEENTFLLKKDKSDSAIGSDCSVATDNERRGSEETVSNNEVPRPSSCPELSSVRPEADEYSHRDGQTTRDGTTTVDTVSDVGDKTKEDVQREHIISFHGIAPTDGTSNEKAKYACGNNRPMRLNSHTSETNIKI